MDLAGKHVVVTGGSQGIGLAVGRLISERGAAVSLVARTDVTLADAVASIGGETAWATADVTDAGAVNRAFAELTTRHGPCDLLITCAGVAHPGYFEDLDASVFRAQMNLLYFGTLNAVRAVLPAMLERGSGGLVGVASSAALVGVFGYGAYAPAKFAVRGLMETLRAEYAHRGLYVGCAFPGDTLTPGFEAENLLKPPECVAVSAGIAAKEASEVAAAIVNGIERERKIITTDRTTAALAKGGAPMLAIAERQMAAQVRKSATRP